MRKQTKSLMDDVLSAMSEPTVKNTAENLTAGEKEGLLKLRKKVKV